MENFDINKLAQIHSEWVEEMGWNNKSPLELLGLIGSEIGESIEECKNGIPTARFGEELSDIVLRIMHVGHLYNVDLKNLLETTYIEWTLIKYPLIKDQLLELVVDWSKWMNSVRKEIPDEKFIPDMGKILTKVFFIAIQNNISLPEEIERKMELNLTKGNRGRKV